MTDLIIEIKDRKFVNATCGNNVISEIRPRHIVANGWDCRIFGNGKIYCETKETYRDGEHFMKFVIDFNGSYHLKLRRPNQKSII
ncbi:MAG: hypothetical protein HFJ40_03975 [Clostridia bacterium]|nr:hypothetical protein [Clostridia bacterium]